jgi:hypothetical protein
MLLKKTGQLWYCSTAPVFPNTMTKERQKHDRNEVSPGDEHTSKLYCCEGVGVSTLLQWLIYDR